MGALDLACGRALAQRRAAKGCGCSFGGQEGVGDGPADGLVAVPLEVELVEPATLAFFALVAACKALNVTDTGRELCGTRDVRGVG